MTELRIEDLVVRRGGADRVRGVSLRVRSGELVVLLGPNGAGKTLTLQAGLGIEMPNSGRVWLDAENVLRLSAWRRARSIAYLPQSRPLAWPSRVEDLVALGRFAYGAAPGRLSEVDAEAVEGALVACQIETLRHRRADTLSGGELARVHCARAFAAGAPLMVADEPVAALDPRQQFRVMDLFRSFVSEGGGALVVLHDIALAARYADRLIWMQAGQILADGTPEETLTDSRLAQIYGVRARIDGRSVELLGFA